MDSISEITGNMQQTMPIFPSSSADSEEKKPCPHGNMVRVSRGGGLCTWDCSECSDEEDKKEKSKADAEKRLARFNRLMWDGTAGTAIPKRFKDKTLGNYVSEQKDQSKIVGICQKYIENFESVAEKGTSLVFCGKPGTGKTHLAYAIITALRKSKIAAVLSSASDMTAEIKEAYKSDTTDITPTTVTARFAGLDLLVIDEVGVQVSSEAEKRIFFDVINKRYEEMLPTILISNLELPELTKFVGERVIDRMKENGGLVFAFDWKSNR